jgi:hypothetical protein
MLFIVTYHVALPPSCCLRCQAGRRHCRHAATAALPLPMPPLPHSCQPTAVATKLAAPSALLPHFRRHRHLCFHHHCRCCHCCHFCCRCRCCFKLIVDASHRRSCRRAAGELPLPPPPLQPYNNEGGELRDLRCCHRPCYGCCHHHHPSHRLSS